MPVSVLKCCVASGSCAEYALRGTTITTCTGGKEEEEEEEEEKQRKKIKKIPSVVFAQ